MKYDLQNDEKLMACSGCGWEGMLWQTDDQDVLNADFQTIGKTCVCPKCGAEVAPSKSLEVLDHAAGVADDLITRALAIVRQVQDGEKSPLFLASAVGHMEAASKLLKARRVAAGGTGGSRQAAYPGGGA